MVLVEDLSKETNVDARFWQALRNRSRRSMLPPTAVRVGQDTVSRAPRPSGIVEARRNLATYGWVTDSPAYVCFASPDELEAHDDDRPVIIEGTHRFLSQEEISSPAMEPGARIPVRIIFVRLTREQRRACGQLQNFVAHAGQAQSFLDTLVTYVSMRLAGCEKQDCHPGLENGKHVMRVGDRFATYPPLFKAQQKFADCEKAHTATRLIFAAAQSELARKYKKVTEQDFVKKKKHVDMHGLNSGSILEYFTFIEVHY